MTSFLHKTFSSLKIRNFRLYFIGQLISMSGTFLQTLAQDWLVLKLTNSGAMLGLVSACQFLPMLILMPYGGVIADRFPKLRLLFITQTVSGILSLALGILVLTGLVHVWMVFVFAILLGLTNGIDNPTRQSFVFQLVGKDEVKNAVSLWGLLISITRIGGSALAGILIASIGIGQCFVVNAASYVFVILAFCLMRTSEMHITAVVAKAKGQVKEGFDYMRRTPVLLNALVLMAIIGTMTYEWQASLPLFARFVLHGDAVTYSILAVALGIGMLVAGLYTASTAHVTQKKMVISALLLGVVTIAVSFTSTLALAVIGFIFVGATFMVFANMTNSLLQLNTDPNFRGRIMSFWNMAFQGSTAIGGPIVGVVGQYFGAQWAVAIGGIAAVVAGLYGWRVLRK